MTWVSRRGVGALHGYFRYLPLGENFWTGSRFYINFYNYLPIFIKISTMEKYWDVVRNIYMEFGITDAHVDRLYYKYRNLRWRWTVTYPFRVKFFFSLYRTNLWRYRLKWKKRFNYVRTWWWRDVRKELLLKETRRE
jgi:hypothetical protein